MAASQEYIDFMLGSKTKSKLHSSSSPSHFTPPPERSSNVSSPKAQSSLQSIQKAFVLVLVEWIELDDQLYSIILSISNLRDRIWHTSRMLHDLSTTTISPMLESSITWKQFGYRSDNASSFTSIGNKLSTDDLNMAMDHSLQHHERMIRELRHRISSMNTLQEKMGRRYDELYRAEAALHFQSDALAYKAPSINDLQELLISTAKELYRKQAMVVQICETAVVDSLLYFTDDATANVTFRAGVGNPDRSPRKVAQKCSEQWPREHHVSYIHGHLSLLNELLLQYTK